MRRRSLQLRLAARLALVYVLAVATAVSFFIYQAYNTATSLSDRELGLRAADLVPYVSVDNQGRGASMCRPSWHPRTLPRRVPACTRAPRPTAGLAPPPPSLSPN